MPISVSLADTLNPEPEYIVSHDPAELIRLFHQSLERRHTAIVADVARIVQKTILQHCERGFQDEQYMHLGDMSNSGNAKGIRYLAISAAKCSNRVIP